MQSAVTIRAATSNDAPALAALHVRSWQWSYRGQVPEAYLEQLGVTLGERTQARRSQLEHLPPENRWWVAEQSADLAGFVVTGPSEDDDAAPLTAQVMALYLDPEAVGKGIGRALLAHAMADFRRRGFRRATLWVLETNERARRFYEAAGWAPDGARQTEERPGFLLHEVRYATAL